MFNDMEKKYYCIYRYQRHNAKKGLRKFTHAYAIECETKDQAVEALCQVNSTTGTAFSRYRYCTENELPDDVKIISYEDYEVGCY